MTESYDENEKIRIYKEIMELLWRHEPQAADCYGKKLWDAMELPEWESSSEDSEDD